MSVQAELAVLIPRIRAIADPYTRDAAVKALVKKYGKIALNKKDEPKRNVAQRRGYAERKDPHGYIRDIIGRNLSSQQEQMIDLVMQHDRVLLPSGTNLGKSDAISALALYFFDCVAALPSDDGRAERGAKILLFGPSSDSVFNFYKKMLQHAIRAESRGFAMPGRRSEDSVLWRVPGSPGWEVEALTPSVRVHQTAAHTVSGRHEGIQFGVMEEAQGMLPQVVAAVEGMLSSDGDILVGLYNPTEASGPMFQRSRKMIDGLVGSEYTVLHLSALDHPNVKQRNSVIEAAVSYKVIDGRVMRECRDRGRYPMSLPDPTSGDFLYALPPMGAEDPAPRFDGIAGHRDGEVHVYQPEALFESQVLGRYPVNLDTGLFNPSAIDASMQRWQETNDPSSRPDRIGLDAAREGDDDSCFAPSWGDDAETIIRAWTELETARDLAGMQAMKSGSEDGSKAHRRIRIGEVRIAPKGDGITLARYVTGAFPGSPLIIDEGGGTSALDHARRVMRVSAEGVSFAAAAPPTLPGERYCDNTRAALYVRLAMLLDRGLIDLPYDSSLREELLAHKLKPSRRTVEVVEGGARIKKLMPSVLIQPKEEIKALLGRSPDRSDAVVLSVWKAIKRRSYAGEMPFGT